MRDWRGVHVVNPKQPDISHPLELLGVIVLANRLGDMGVVCGDMGVV